MTYPYCGLQTKASQSHRKATKMQQNNFTDAKNVTSARSSYAILAPPLFSTIIVVGFIGNTLLIDTILRWREMRTPCNYLILNNAVADLGVVLIAAPLNIVATYRGWVLGEAACRILAPTQDVFVVVSVITYTIIAWERYRAVMSPFKSHLTLKNILIAAVIIWVIAYLGTGLPMAMLVSVVTTRGQSHCMASFPSDIARQLYEVYLVVVFLALPLILQTLAYTSLVHRLTRRNSVDRSLRTCTSSRSRKVKKRRLVRVTIILVAFFQVCYIPRMVMMMIFEFARELTNNTFFEYINLFLMVLFYVKHVINPIILFSISTDFRKRSPCNVHNCFRAIPLRRFSSRRSTQNTRVSLHDGTHANERKIIVRETGL